MVTTILVIIHIGHLLAIVKGKCTSWVLIKGHIVNSVSLIIVPVEFNETDLI